MFLTDESEGNCHNDNYEDDDLDFDTEEFYSDISKRNNIMQLRYNKAK